MKNRNTNTSTRPLFVRVICWILIVLMISGAIYYTIMGIGALISSITESSSETTSLPVSVRDAVTVLGEAPSLRI